MKRQPEDPPGAWYADAIRRQLDEKYGAERVESDGLLVDVAMDPAMQKAAEDALEAQLRVVDKRQGWRGAPFHLDAAQVRAALPVWRERLQAVEARPGEVVVWDLARAPRDEDEADREPLRDVVNGDRAVMKMRAPRRRRMRRPRRRPRRTNGPSSRRRS